VEGTGTSRAGGVVRATRATYVAFAGAGFAFASWASRIPQVRDHLGLSPAQLGLVLLSIAAGSAIALPLSGPVVTRFGSRRVVTWMALLQGGAMAMVALGYLVGVAPVVAGLFVFGFSAGAWDVAMNVQGAVVERLLGRSIMSRFHAGFSIGTVAGALVGALIVALSVPVTAHLLGAAVVVTASVGLETRAFVGDHAGEERPPDDAPVRTTRHALTAWREPRTLLIGVMVLAFAFSEGAAGDWTGIAVIDGYGQSKVVGVLGLATFHAAMTTARWFGPAWLDRFGRVAVTRALALVAAVGVLLFVLGVATWLAFVGIALWGLGTSLGFPVGMSAGADDPVRSAARVSVIASIGYWAFLAGPPFIGFVGDHVTVLRALLAVPVALGVAAAIAGATRPPTT